MLSPETKDVFAALTLAQAEIKNVIKESDNPFFKSKYADLGSVRDAIREALANHDLAIISGMTDLDGPIEIKGQDEKTGEEYTDYGCRVSVQTFLTHSSGQYIAFEGATFVKGLGAQAVGSAFTYLRRYQEAAIIGLASADDDGEAAHGRTEVKKTFENRPQAPIVKIGEMHKKVTAELGRTKWPADSFREYLKNTFKKDKLGSLTEAEAEKAYEFLKDWKPTVYNKKEDEQ